MKYDEIVNFFRKGPPGCSGKTMEKHRVHIADGHVAFVHGRPVYQAPESNNFRYVQTWFWRDWSLEIDDPLQHDVEHAAEGGRGPFLILAHAPASLGEKRAVALFSPTAGRFMPHSKSTFDTSVTGTNRKLSAKQRDAFVDRLSKEKVKMGRDQKSLHVDYANPLAHVILREIDVFKD